MQQRSTEAETGKPGKIYEKLTPVTNIRFLLRGLSLVTGGNSIGTIVNVTEVLPRCSIWPVRPLTEGLLMPRYKLRSKSRDGAPAKSVGISLSCCFCCTCCSTLSCCSCFIGLSLGTSSAARTACESSTSLDICGVCSVYKVCALVTCRRCG